jgi:hypothetical protein
VELSVSGHPGKPALSHARRIHWMHGSDESRCGGPIARVDEIVKRAEPPQPSVLLRFGIGRYWMQSAGR